MGTNTIGICKKKFNLILLVPVRYLFLDISPPPAPLSNCPEGPRGTVNAYNTGRTTISLNVHIPAIKKRDTLSV